MKLSIAIPTYNFGPFIGATLRSILAQPASAGVEILVVDGASTDDTEAVVSSFAGVRYVKLPKRGGIDADMDHAVRASSGDFVWLCSADDLMIEGALASVLGLLDGDVDLLLGCHTNCDREMVSQGEHPVSSDRSPRIVDLGSASERRRWLAAAVSTEAVFSFMSTLVVRRSTWIDAEGDHFVGTCWSHVARLFGVAARGPLRCHFTGQLWIARRGDNDSFMDRGLVHRYRIAFFLLDIFRALFGVGSLEAEGVRRLLQWEFSRSALLAAAKIVLVAPTAATTEEWRTIVRELYPTDGPADSMRRALLTNVRPLNALVAVRDVYLRTPLPKLRRRWSAFTRTRRERSAAER